MGDERMRADLEILRQRIESATLRIDQQQREISDLLQFKRETEKTHTCESCNTEWSETNPVTLGPNPYAHDVNNDDTPVWECDSCRAQSADDI